MHGKWSLEQKRGDWRIKDGVNPGGPLLQCGIHIIDILLGWFGSVTKVSAMKQDDITDNSVTDNIISLIHLSYYGLLIRPKRFLGNILIFRIRNPVFQPFFTFNIQEIFIVHRPGGTIRIQRIASIHNKRCLYTRLFPSLTFMRVHFGDPETFRGKVQSLRRRPGF